LKKVTVLGCGLVGAAIARDLSREEDLEITVADADRDALGRIGAGSRIRRLRADLAFPETVERIVADADAVVGALPGRLGFGMLEAVIRAGKPIADISFSPEDPLSLDGLAQEKGVTAVVDCGVSPGLSNLAVGRAAASLAEVEEVAIQVGGLPVNRNRPFEYAIVFSASDVLEEYTRPARVMEEGTLVTKPALSEVETVEVPGVGTLEAFLTDGLRTLLTTVPARAMKEKTLRYPGHARAMAALRDCGFFERKRLETGDAPVSPRALTERLLASAWRLSEGEEEFTFLRTIVRGLDPAGSPRAYRFELLDRTDAKARLTSMARTTGFPCAAAAAMLARGQYRDPGVRPPEMLARDEAASQRFLDALRARGLSWTESWDSNPKSKI
jgi:saccharopine dehydrogenase-like NADP-dependent oxidoreductase